MVSVATVHFWVAVSIGAGTNGEVSRHSNSSIFIFVNGFTKMNCIF